MPDDKVNEGLYRVYLLLGSVRELILLLNTEMRPNFPAPMNAIASESEEDALPITSYICMLPPRKRKESTMKMAEATFHNHVYGKERKRST